MIAQNFYSLMQNCQQSAPIFINVYLTLLIIELRN